MLLDFDLVVVHLLDPERRAFYALEVLWGDVPRLPFTPKERPAPVRQAAEGLHPDAFPTGWPDALDDLHAGTPRADGDAGTGDW